METAAQVEVSTLDHVFALEIQSEGVWWLSGVFKTRKRATAARRKYYPDNAYRVTRRVVR